MHQLNHNVTSFNFDLEPSCEHAPYCVSRRLKFHDHNEGTISQWFYRSTLLLVRLRSDLIPSMRCSKCSKKNVVENHQIVFVQFPNQLISSCISGFFSSETSKTSVAREQVPFLIFLLRDLFIVTSTIEAKTCYSLTGLILLCCCCFIF